MKYGKTGEKRGAELGELGETRGLVVEIKGWEGK